jgi:hypothetical protein
MNVCMRTAVHDIARAGLKPAADARARSKNNSGMHELPASSPACMCYWEKSGLLHLSGVEGLVFLRLR